MKEIRISIDSRSFVVLVDQFSVPSSRYKRFRIVSYNNYFNYIIGDAIILVTMTPTPSYSPKRKQLADPARHDQLLRAIYNALAAECVMES